MKITYTETPLITSTGFIPDEDTRQNDSRFRRMQARRRAKREQALELLILLSSLESVMLRDGILPEHLSDRIDTAVATLRSELLDGDE